MEPRLTWQARECGSGKTCAGLGRHVALPGGRIVQGYLITDPQVLTDLGAPPESEGFLWVPDDVLPDSVG
jgi:hypothetical protein